MNRRTHSTPKIITLLSNPPPGNEKLQIQFRNQCTLTYQISAFLFKVRAPNKDFFNVGSYVLELEPVNS